MGIPRFFCPEPLPEPGPFRLPEALAHHATRVLRMREGDELVLFDGRGGEVPARLGRDAKCWHADLGIGVAVERESPLEVVLVQSLASADKMDWVVQKAVELGVAAVVPLDAERSVLRLTGERAAKRLAHWQQVAVAACEQCGRNRVPRIEAVTGLQDYLARTRSLPDRFVLALGGARGMRAIERPRGPVHVLVGPEGGWSEAELTTLQLAACRTLTLGPRVLRTETAGLAALSAIQALWGDF